MSLADPRTRRPRRSQPIVEGLETRELMSAAPGSRRGPTWSTLRSSKNSRTCSTVLTRPRR